MCTNGRKCTPEEYHRILGRYVKEVGLTKASEVLGLSTDKIHDMLTDIRVIEAHLKGVKDKLVVRDSFGGTKS